MAGFISKYADSPWFEIETKYCEGTTSIDLSKEYDIPANVIRAKASDERWKTPHFMKKQEDQLFETGTVDDSLTEREVMAVKEKVDSRIQEMEDARIKHKRTIIKITEGALADLEHKPIRIKSAHDLERIDAVMRRTLDMDETKDNSQVTVNIGAPLSLPTPIRDITPTDV